MGVNPRSYINIQGWMVSDLHLKGNELLLYSLIYGFSQDDGSRFQGSLKYMSDWLGCTKQTVINTTESLIQKGYLKKVPIEVKGVARYQYVALVPDSTEVPVPDSAPKETKKQKKESILSDKSKEIIAGFSPALAKAVMDWSKYKRERHDKYTPTGADKLIAQIKNFADKYGEQAMIDVIDRSIAAGYQGIVWDWLKRQPPVTGAPGSQTGSVMDNLRALHERYEQEGT